MPPSPTSPSAPFPNLDRYEIWDSYSTPAHTGPDGDRLNREIERLLPVAEAAGFRRCCLFFQVGLGTADAETDARARAHPEAVFETLARWPDKLIGMIYLNANDVRGSLDALDRWLRDGPMVGVYFPGGRWGSLAANHPNYYPLVERIAKLDGVIMQHNWHKTGGKGHPGESTPAELAQLAARYPEQPFISAHAAGNWEIGIRAVRHLANVYVETSGFDPTSGFTEMAVRDLGAERVVFGSHLPGRSLGTEIGKIVGAEISEETKHKIFGANFRRLLDPVMRRKGL